MKKIIVIGIIGFCVLFAISFYCYNSYQAKLNKIIETNEKYLKYENTAFRGTELISIINQIIDDNAKNKIAKNEKNEFIENDTNSIKADIYFTDNETTYLIEMIYDAGIQEFAKNFSNQAFRCTKIEYHEKTKLIKYLHFEQIPSSYSY